MNKSRKSSARAPAKPSRASEQPAVALTPHPPKLRWSVLVCAAGTFALAVGYVSGRLLPAPAAATSAAAEEVPPKTASPTTVKDAPDKPLPDPERPGPKVVAELTQEVEEAMDHLQAVFPNTPDTLEMKARSEHWLGHTAEAMRVWQQCLELDAKHFHAYVGMAKTAMEKGEHAEAIEFANRAIAIDSGNYLARVVKADALLNLGQPADAVSVLADYIQVDPRSRGLYLLGQAYVELKEFEKARVSLQDAVLKFPEYAEAHFLLARTFRELGNEELSQRHMEAYKKYGTHEQMVERLRGDNATDLDQMGAGAAILYSDAGRLFMFRERPADAENFWRRAALLDDKNVACRQSLAFLCRQQNRIGETIAWFKELAEIEPRNVSYWLEMGALFEELSAMPAAEKALRRACEVAPNQSDGHAALADLLVRFERDPAEAVTLAYTAVKLSPTARNFALLSAAYLGNGENTAALASIQQALRMAPQSASYRAVLDSIKSKQ